MRAQRRAAGNRAPLGGPGLRRRGHVRAAGGASPSEATCSRKRLGERRSRLSPAASPSVVEEANSWVQARDMEATKAVPERGKAVAHEPRQPVRHLHIDRRAGLLQEKGGRRGVGRGQLGQVAALDNQRRLWQRRPLRALRHGVWLGLQHRPPPRLGACGELRLPWRVAGPTPRRPFLASLSGRRLAFAVRRNLEVFPRRVVCGGSFGSRARSVGAVLDQSRRVGCWSGRCVVGISAFKMVCDRTNLAPLRRTRSCTASYSA